MKCWIASREPVGLGVHGGRSDRQDARALAAAHDAVLVLAAAQRGHALEVDDRVEPFGCDFIIGLGQGTRLLRDFVAAVWLALVVEDLGLGHEQGDDLARVIAPPGVVQVFGQRCNEPGSRPSPRFPDGLQRGVGLPWLERRADDRKSADVDRLMRMELDRPAAIPNRPGPRTRRARETLLVIIHSGRIPGGTSARRK